MKTTAVSAVTAGTGNVLRREATPMKRLTVRMGWPLVSLMLAGATARCGTTTFSASGDAGGSNDATRAETGASDAGSGSGTSASSGPGSSSGSGSAVGSGQGLGAPCLADEQCEGKLECCLVVAAGASATMATCAEPADGGFGPCGNAGVELCNDDTHLCKSHPGACQLFACDGQPPATVYACDGLVVDGLVAVGACATDKGLDNGKVCNRWSDCESAACCPMPQAGVSPGQWVRQCAASCELSNAAACAFGTACPDDAGTCSLYECASMTGSQAVEQQCSAANAESVAAHGITTALWDCTAVPQ